MAEHLTEDEELQVLKQWWRENGRSTILVIVVCIASYFGWQFWKSHQQQQAEAAAVIYDDLLQAITSTPGQPLTEENRKTADYLIGQLKTEYGSSLYALSAAMYAAKIAVEVNELESAAENLKWALDQSHSSETDNILRLRLARVMTALQDYDQALTYSEYDTNDDFTSLFATVRGDAYLAKGDIQAARAAYQLALDNFPSPQQQQRQFLEMKIANLPRGSAGATESDQQQNQSGIDGRGFSE